MKMAILVVIAPFGPLQVSGHKPLEPGSVQLAFWHSTIPISEIEITYKVIWNFVWKNIAILTTIPIVRYLFRTWAYLYHK